MKTFLIIICQSNDCRSNDCRSNKCRSNDCRSYDCRSNDCRSNNCRSYDCRSYDCRSYDCRSFKRDPLTSVDFPSGMFAHSAYFSLLVITSLNFDKTTNTSSTKSHKLLLQ